MPVPTPSQLPGGPYVTRSLVLPSDAEWLLLVGGALAEMLEDDYFDDTDGIPAETVREYIIGMLDQFYG